MTGRAARLTGSLVGVALGAALAAGARSAAAQPTPGDVVLAESLFREGRRLFDAGDYAAACPKLAESQRLDPGGGTLLNLARCHEAEGKLATAWAEYQEARAWARREGRDDRLQIAEQSLASLEPRLPWLVVTVPPASDVEGLEVELDGRTLPRSAFGVPAPVDPGPHRVVVRAPGKEPHELEVRVERESERRTITVEPLADAAPPPPAARSAATAGGSAAPSPAGAEAAPREPAGTPTPAAVTATATAAAPGRRRTAAYAMGAGGLIALGIGSGAGLRAIHLMSESDERCPDGACTARGAELSRDANRLANVANVGIGLGIAGVAAAIVLSVVEAGGRAAARGASVTVTASEEGGWIGLRGHY